eukprot:Nitzschia sp. Nitz4//scaffold475_size5561//117//2954//NITZ4_009215-RA/size5561-processed-gene-0.5-mRNA-1//-1//CDS//3329552711//4103//frame0
MSNRPSSETDPLIVAKSRSDNDTTTQTNHKNNDNTTTSPTSLTGGRHTKISSLDLERVINSYSIQTTKERYGLSPLLEDEEEDENDGRITAPPTMTQPPQPHRKVKLSTGRTATRWMLSAIVGLLTGLTTIVIVQCTGSIVRWRTRTLDYMAQSRDISNASVLALFSLVNACLALGACFLCIAWAPEGTGSGIPQVQAYLNGVRVKKFSQYTLFGVKILGTILSVSSSLAVGMEGPLIHIGAIVGASVTKLSTPMSRFLTSPLLGPLATTATTTSGASNHASVSCFPSVRRLLYKFVSTNLSHFSTDAERRDFVSIGASVGFAASFGAPIGGLLFVLDDISSYFSKDMILRTLVANAIGTFCLALRSGNLSNYSVINLGTYEGASATDDILLNRFEFMPLYLVIAVAGGILGGLFCKCFGSLKVHVMDKLTTPHAKLLHIAILSLVTSALTFGLPVISWACAAASRPGTSISQELLRVNHVDQSRQFFCEAGQVNELATIMFGSRDDAIKRILADPSQFHPRTLWTIGTLFFALMTITYGSYIPCGIFTPTVLIGASLGGATGLAFQTFISPDIIPSTFALLGVAAMLAGTQRSTVSVCVILVEGTGQVKVLLPVIIVVLIARYVANWVHADGIYQTSMEFASFPYLVHEERRRYDIFQIHEIMSSPVDVIGPSEKAANLVAMLKNTSHNGFPVVDRNTKKFLGLVRRDQIVALIECGVFQDPIDEAKRHHSRNSSTASLLSSRHGFANNPLMHRAYYVEDDRYDYVSNLPPATLEDEDEFDRHEWIRNIHDKMKRVPTQRGTEIDEDLVPATGDDTMPPMKRIASTANNIIDSNQQEPNRMDEEPNAMPREFASVGVDSFGNLIVTWLNPEFEKHYVDLSCVLNQGTYCVPEHLPVSKARLLFTNLGLRHVVVLGGPSGGEVVGMFTRANLMPSYIEAKTGVSF